MNKAVGFLLLIAVIVGVALFALQSGTGPGTRSSVTLKGFIGGEKRALIEDPKVVAVLRRKYGITLEVQRRGSIEMATDPAAVDQDFLWPSSEFAADLYSATGRPTSAKEVVLYSPIVLYSWKSVVEPLRQRGIVASDGKAHVVEDMPKLLDLVAKGTEWKSVGVPKLFGRMAIYSTDPKQSNSGTMLAALLANLLNEGNVVTEGTLPAVAPKVKAFFDRQGFMESSSDAIFTQALNRGVGDKPIFVGYEAQLLGTLATQPDLVTRRTDPMQILYPRPTVWTSHVLIAIKPEAKRLIEALKDPEIQELAWKGHGFRSATGRATDPNTFAEYGVPETVDSVIPLPQGRTLKRLIDGL